MAQSPYYFPANMGGMIFREYTEKDDVNCDLDYTYTVCQFTGDYSRYYATGCSWDENKVYIQGLYNSSFAECCADPSKIGERDYTYCNLGEITGVKWPYPTGIMLSSVSEQLECTDAPACPTGAWCYNVKATVDWPPPTGSGCGEDPYDPDAGCPSDLDIYLKVEKGCNSLDTDHVIYYSNTQVDGYNMMSGQWTASLNQDSHPGCAPMPSGAEIITATGFDENRTFYSWWNQYSKCAVEQTGVDSEIEIENCGQPSIEVAISDAPYSSENVFTVPGGDSIRISSLAYGGYGTSAIPTFSSGTKIEVRKIHPELNGQCPVTEGVKYRGVYNFNQGLVGAMIPLSGITSNEFSAFSETENNVNVGSYKVEVWQCPCDTGEAGFLCVPGTVCCEGTPQNKASVSVTFGSSSTGVTVNIPYVFYGTGLYTGQCIAYIENQKTGQCYSVTDSESNLNKCDNGCSSFTIPQSTIAYGGIAAVHFSKFYSEAEMLCTTNNQKDIETTCCPIPIEPDNSCTNLVGGWPFTGCDPEYTQSGWYPGGVRYSPSGDYLSILDMKLGQTNTPFYEGFITGCLTQKNTDGEYVINLVGDRTYTIQKTGENLCASSGDYGKVIGKVYEISFDSSGQASNEMTGYDSNPPINYDGAF